MSDVILYYSRYFNKQTSKHDSIEKAIRCGMYLVDYNEGWPYKIVIDGEVVWDVENKFGEKDYRDIFEFAEECGIDRYNLNT